MIIKTVRKLDTCVSSLSEIDDNPDTSYSGDKIPVQITQRAPKVVDHSEKSKPARKVIKRNNLALNAIDLPSVMNINPRSVYNKVNEFLTLVGEYESDLILCQKHGRESPSP